MNLFFVDKIPIDKTSVSLGNLSAVNLIRGESNLKD